MRGENVTFNEVRNACTAIDVLVLVFLCCCGIAYARNALSYRDWHLEAEVILLTTLSISKQSTLEQMNTHPEFTASHFLMHINYFFSEDGWVE